MIFRHVSLYTNVDLVLVTIDKTNVDIDSSHVCNIFANVLIESALNIFVNLIIAHDI